MYKRKLLQNGVRFMTIPMPATKTFTVLVMVATGSRYENKNNNGISHFLEHMFFKGTAKRPDTLAISTELDKVGGEYNAFTAKEYTGYYAKVASRHAGAAIDVISDILLNSKFDSQEIEREKGVIIEEMNMYENNPVIHLDDLFEECIYGNTPAGWDTIGTKENVRSFKRKDFISYLNSQYQGADIIVGLAGNFKAQDATASKKLFSKLPAGDKNKASEFLIKQSAPRVKIKKQQTRQVSLSLGVSAYSYHHEDYYVAKLLGIILGGSMSSRMFITVRERRGLAYQVHTQTEAYHDSGYLTTVVGTSKDRAGEAIKAILAEYKKITKMEIAAAELQKAKDYVKGKTTLQLESSTDLASWYLKQEVLGRELLTPEKYFKKIDAVKTGDLSRVAKDVLKSEKLNLAVIGEGIDEKNLKKMLAL